MRTARWPARPAVTRSFGAKGERNGLAHVHASGHVHGVVNTQPAMSLETANRIVYRLLKEGIRVLEHLFESCPERNGGACAGAVG